MISDMTRSSQINTLPISITSNISRGKWCSYKGTNNIREFEDFVEKNPVFVYKPLAESSGRGIVLRLGKISLASALYQGANWFCGNRRIVDCSGRAFDALIDPL